MIVLLHDFYGYREFERPLKSKLTLTALESETDRQIDKVIYSLMWEATSERMQRLVELRRAWTHADINEQILIKCELLGMAKERRVEWTHMVSFLKEECGFGKP
jgi:hypothetical protein